LRAHNTLVQLFFLPSTPILNVSSTALQTDDRQQTNGRHHDANRQSYDGQSVSGKDVDNSLASCF